MDSQNNARVDLTLIEEGGRRMDSAPNNVRIGAVCLRGWQIDHIDVPSDEFDGYDTFLIKINYDLELELGLPSLSWFDVTFGFVSDEEENLVTVIDALPRSGTFTDAPKPYVLNQFLNLVPCEDSTSAHALLPPSADRVDTFGIGGQSVRWRYVSIDETGVRSGSYAAWVTLLVPAGQAEQRVEFSARYDLPVGPDAAYRPTQTPTDFRLRLSAPSDTPGVVTPSLSASADIRSQEYFPSVFICYAHDSLTHKDYALRFGNLLVRNGVDARMDQWDANHRKDWDFWAREHINNVDFVIVLASPICRAAFDGELTGPDNPGIRSEAATIREKLHAYRDEWTSKVLPVVLPHEFVDNVPEALQRWTADHYVIDRLTPNGIDELLRAMTGVPRYIRPPLGKLPPSIFKPLTGTES